MKNFLTSVWVLILSACLDRESNDRNVNIYFEIKPGSKTSITASRVSEDHIEHINKVIPNLYFMESGKKDFTYQDLSNMLMDYRIGKSVSLTYDTSKPSGKLMASAYLADGYWFVLLLTDITSECRAKLIHVSKGNTVFVL